MSRNDLFPFQSGCSFVAVIESLPQDTGDSFYLKIEHEDGKTTELLINPNSSDFVGMVKVKAYNDI